jgi:hypothetical protein
MKPYLFALMLAALPLKIMGQSSQKNSQVPHPNAPATQEIQTEQVDVPKQPPAVSLAPANAPDRQEVEQVKTLAHRIWLAEFRLNDLLSQVKPDKWKMTPGVRQSFNETLDSLHKSVANLESWRVQFEMRPDSLYLGFMTYVSLSAVLPRVDGIARSVSSNENGSFGAQFSQAENQLFDLQQQVEPHLAVLLKNQDNVLLMSQSNLATCQNQLNFSEHGREGKAVPMKNIAPVFQGHPRTSHPAASNSAAKPGESKVPAGNTPSQKPPDKTQKN